MATKTATKTIEPPTTPVDPVEPDPVEPDPVEPDPVEPDPVEPDPVEGGEAVTLEGVEPRAAAGNCGGTPCAGSARKRLTFTNGNVAKVFTFTPTNYTGPIAWDFGDGSAIVVATGPVVRTYVAAGAKTVIGTPVASSVRMASIGVVVTVP